MAGVNKAILIGNLGKDPELRYTPGGQAVASFSLATSEKWRDKEGVAQDRTEWHNIVVWGRQAEIAKEYLAKGGRCISRGGYRRVPGKIKTVISAIRPRSFARGCNSSGLGIRRRRRQAGERLRRKGRPVMT